MRTITFFRHTPSFNYTIVAGVLAFALVFTGCDSGSDLDASLVSSELDIEESVAFMSADLNLSSDQLTKFEGAFESESGHRHEPGFLWEVAARIQADLTDEQRVRLLERIANRPIPTGQAGNGMTVHDHLANRNHALGRIVGSMLRVIELTDEQRTLLAELREEFKLELRAITESARNGEIDRSQARIALQELGEQLRSEIELLLTPEQLEALEARRLDLELKHYAAREAERQAMIDVLGLSTDQLTSLDELQAALDEDRESFRELIEDGASVEEIRELAAASYQAHHEALAGILDQVQYEIYVIHGAISSRMKLQGGGDQFARPFGQAAGHPPVMNGRR